jgi:phenylpropionate dioxygenase-like ring-hydroxylating dioxygenase large terminal subunit
MAIVESERGSEEIVAGLAIDADQMDRILADGATLPAPFYTDERIARLEDKLVWRRDWQMVGVEPEVRNVGDFFTTQIAGFDFVVPVVVVRGKDSKLRAFINVCRHRAHFVAVGCGNRKSLQCTYHGWTYGLDGCLRGVPRSEEGGLPPFEKLSLYPLPLETWKGYIFVALEPQHSLAEALGGLPEVLDSTGFAFPFAEENADPEFEYARVVTSSRVETNWKAMEENNVECYHCPTTHTHSFSELYNVKPGTYLHREFDRGVYHTTFYSDEMVSKGATSNEDGPDYQFYYLWPNMTFGGGRRARFRSGFGRLIPQGVHACDRESVRYNLPASEHITEDERRLQEEFDEGHRLTAEEDQAAAARVQTGLKSGMYEWGYTLPESERNMRHFYGLVWNSLAPAFR